MAVYLKALPPRDAPPPVTDSARLVDPTFLEQGRHLYDKECTVCHGDDGKGHPPFFPPLANNRSIVMASPVNSIRMVLNGGYAPGTRKNARPHGMPPFSHLLDDAAAASVITYVRVAWGNSGTPVTPAQVNELRKALAQ